jgi:hypothetical protein
VQENKQRQPFFSYCITSKQYNKMVAKWKERITIEPSYFQVLVVGVRAKRWETGKKESIFV